MNDGTARAVTIPSMPEPIAPTSWHLHVDEAGPSGTTPHDADLTALQDWRSISGLETVSGTGTYTATVKVPAPWLTSDRGVYLDLGAIDGAMQAYVDGRQVAPDVVADRRFDVSGLLHPGDNQLRVVVTTTPKNEVVAQCRKGDLSGQGTLCAQPATQPYGLLGPVRFVPLTRER